MREIPFFSSSKEINKIADYERFCNSHAYLKKKAGRVKSFYKDKTPQIQKRAVVCGYSDFNSFIEHRQEWVLLERKIPRVYLEEIGVKLKTLHFTAQLDKKEYETVLEKEFRPQNYLINFSPIPVSRFLPAGIAEKKAVEIIKREAKKYETLCLIKYPDLKTVLIHPEGEVSTQLYYPNINIDKKYVVPSTTNKKLGSVFIK